MEEKIVELARFTSLEEGQILVSLLKSHGVNCYLRNEIATQVMGPLNMQGVRVELLEEDIPRAMDIMIEHGYDLPEVDESPQVFPRLSKWSRHIPFFGKMVFEKQIIILLILLVCMLALLIYGNTLLSA